MGANMPVLHLGVASVDCCFAPANRRTCTACTGGRPACQHRPSHLLIAVAGLLHIGITIDAVTYRRLVLLAMGIQFQPSGQLFLCLPPGRTLPGCTQQQAVSVVVVCPRACHTMHRAKFSQGRLPYRGVPARCRCIYVWT